MNVIKSLHASLMQRQFQYKHRYFTSSSVYWGFKLSTGEPVVEQDYWSIISQYIGTAGPIDEGMIKEHPEFTVYGNAIAPNQQAVTGLMAEVSFAGKRKVLQVTGNRTWQSSGLSKVASKPEPFVEMPLDYEHAFGGEDFLSNPLGKGFNTEELPNVEYPQQLMATEKAQPTPASFSHLNNDWLDRKALMGTYDQDYIDNHMPGLAPDIDWRHFNAAPKDQWLESELLGQETYQFINLNAEHSELTGSLPAISARFFVQQALDVEQPEQTEFKEIPLKLDTVYFFPNDDLGILVHRGSFEISHPFGRDIQKVLLGHEQVGQEVKSEQHYQEELNKRSDLENGWKYLLNTSPLLPAGVTCGLKKILGDNVNEAELAQGENLKTYAEQSAKEMDGKLDEQLEKTYQELEKQGCEDEIEKLKLAAGKTENVAPEDIEDENLKKMLAIQSKIVGDPEKLAKELDLTQLDLQALEELAEHSHDMAKQQEQDSINNLQQQIEKMKSDPHMAESPEMIAELEQLLAQLTELPVLPRFDPADVAESMEFQQQAMVKQVENLNDPDVLKHLSEEQQQQLLLGRAEFTEFEPDKVQQDAAEFAADSYLQSAHFMEDARSPHAGQEQTLVDKLLAQYQANTEIANVDIAFAKLEQKSLVGINLYRGLLEYSVLAGCNFSRANLEKANFAKAQVSNCDFSAANMKDANLGAASFTACVFSEQIFSDATYGKSTFTDCRFEQCDFGARLDAWLETTLVDCHFIGCDFSAFNFVEIDILSCTFEDCIFDNTNFIKGRQTGSRFVRCTMNSTSFVTPELSNAEFKDSMLNNARFVGGAVMQKCSFSGSVVTESNLREADLTNANFSGAELTKSDLGAAKLWHANFDKAIAKHTQFIESRLEGSSFIRANMMEASLMQADIRGCNFAQANLYSVSFLHATLGETRFAGAYLENTILKDWRP